jgi:Raf kinase inhibitor-like YbhB/YbcL family protein
LLECGNEKSCRKSQEYPLKVKKTLILLWTVIIIIMVFKLALLSLVILLAAGCISKEEVTMENISISSEGFKSGDVIPDIYTCKGKDISPSLSWKGIPAGTKSIALTMDDPDAPGGTFVHWVIYNVPAQTQKLPEGMPHEKILADGSIQGMTDFGEIGYGGPCPPPGKPHRYYFKMYALDSSIDLAPGASQKELENVMEGHILAKGEFMGTYKR